MPRRGDEGGSADLSAKASGASSIEQVGRDKITLTNNHYYYGAGTWEAARPGGGDGSGPPTTSDRAPVAWRGEVPSSSGPVLPREHLHERIVDALLGESGGGQAARVVGLAGMGGAGKTMLARAAARDERVAARFRDGVVWLMVGSEPVASCQAALLHQLGVPVGGGGLETGMHEARRRMASTRHLVVLDDVTSSRQRAGLDVFGPGNVVLMTTRDHTTVPYGQQRLVVDMLECDEARRMVAMYAGLALKDLPDEAGPVVEGCGGLPLALAICGAMIKDGRRWPWLASKLSKPQPDALHATFRNYEHTSLVAALEASVSSLPPQTRSMYEDLAVFAGRGPVPVAVAARVWRHHHRDATYDADDAEVTLDHLADLCLLTFDRDGETFVLHDLLYDYTRHRTRHRLPELHAKLAGSFLHHWDGLEHGLAQAMTRFEPPGPDADSLYGLTYLARHLLQAGRDDHLHLLLAAEPGPGRANTWFALHERTGRLADYLMDLNLARERTRHAVDHGSAPDDRTTGVVLEVRYALMTGSIASLAETLPSGILYALVAQEIWTFEQARTYAGLIPAAEQRSAAFRLLACYPGLAAPDKARLVDLAARAADGIDFVMKRAFSLEWLVGLAPPDQRESYLERALAAADQDRQGSQEIRARIFAGVARWFPERALQELRAGAGRRADAQHYWEPMTDALRHLPDLFEDVLAIARKYPNSSEGRGALLAVLRVSSPQTRNELIAERLAAYDPSDDDLERHIVQDLAPYLPPDKLLSLLSRALEHAGAFSTVAMIAAAIPRLPKHERPALRARALDLLRTEDIDLDHEDIIGLLPLLPASDRIGLLQERTDALLRTDPSSAVHMLVAAAPHLPEHLLRLVIDNPAGISPSTADLNRIAPYLTPALLRHLITTRTPDGQDAHEPEERARALVHLSPGQPPETLATALDLVAAVTDSQRRVKLLTELAPHLPGTLLPAAVRAIPVNVDAGQQAWLLALLAAQAEQPERDQLLQQARERAVCADPLGRRMPPLAELAATPQQLIAALQLQPTLGIPLSHRRPPADPAPLPEMMIRRAIQLVRAGHRHPGGLALSLAALIPYAAPEHRAALLYEASTAALTPHDHMAYDWNTCECPDALAQVVALVPDTARIPLPPDRIRSVLDQDHADERLRQLAILLDYLPAAERGSLAGQVLDCITAMNATQRTDRASDQNASSLRRLAPHLESEARRRAADLARTLDARYQQVGVLADLAAHADPGTRPALLNDAVTQMRATTAAYELDRALGRLIPYLDDARAAELLAHLLQLTHDWRASQIPDTGPNRGAAKVSPKASMG